ncbi:hypothetical protein TNCV_3765371 [Trichonephila clavipes]|nr:hypothetical protein TNCV_3765371 [Trichonephila clavipes]
MLVRLSRAPVLSGGLRRKLSFSPVPSTWPLPPRPHLTSPKKKRKMEQSTLLSVDLWSGREKKKRKIGMARKRAENRERSLGFPGFVKPVFTKDSKPLGRRKRSLGHLGSVKPVLT